MNLDKTKTYPFRFFHSFHFILFQYLSLRLSERTHLLIVFVQELIIIIIKFGKTVSKWFEEEER